jgi:hypothetical protein
LYRLLIAAIVLVMSVNAQSTFNVQVAAKTSTQAILSYAAPSSNACRVEVSENANYTPLVHDVDPSLFPGSDSDLKSGGVVGPTVRAFVVGRRSAERAGDGKTYSRALQAYTTHYFRVSCGQSIGTGSFTTGNIPLGMTYQDLPPENIPTIEAGNLVVDEQTGALAKIAAPNANNFNGSAAFLAYGGFYRVCDPTIVGPENGYLCAFPATGGNGGVAYYYIPSTGEMRFLGGYVIGSSSLWGTNVLAYPKPGATMYHTVIANDGVSQLLLKGTYVGNYSAVAPQSWIQMTWTVVNLDGGSAATALTRLNPTIIATNCGVLSTEGNWLFVDCRSGIQDTYPYAVGVIDATTGRAIAARNMMTESPTRFCGEHNFHFIAPTSGVPLIEFGFQNLSAGGQYKGGGEYVVTLTQGVDATIATLKVSGEPQARTDDLPMTAQVGDVFSFYDNGEMVKILQKNSPTEWVVKRFWDGYYPAIAHPVGSRLYADCGAVMPGGGWAYGYWKFIEDPSGQNLILNRDWPGVAHDDSGPDLHLTEGYGFRRGPIMDNIGLGPNEFITARPLFAEVSTAAMGTATAMHPSFHQVNDSSWFTDERPINGGNLYADTHVNVSGQLYKYTFASAFRDIRIHPKILPTLSFTQGKRLTDISGPGSLISDGPDMPNTFCIAFLDGECRSGSRSGDVYANIPDLTKSTCGGGDGPHPEFHDWCVLDNLPLAQGVLQLGTTPNRIGLLPSDQTTSGVGWSRILSRGFGPIRNISLLAKPTPDGKWLFFSAGGTLLMVKLPPFAKDDNIDRSTFVPATVNIAPNAQASTAVVEFGYVEYGNTGDFYCTSRRESCVAVSNYVNPADPFKFGSTESYSGVACAAGCQITVPLAPQHLAYFQVLYLDSNNRITAIGSRGIIGETGVAAETGTTTPVPHIVAPVSVTPSSGSGLNQTFSFAYADTFGLGDIRMVQMHFQTQLVAGNACYLQYTRATNTIQLVDDSGGGYSGSVLLGTAGKLANSQCALDTGASSISVSGNNLTVNLALTFSGTFTGTKTVSISGVSSDGTFSGWQVKGTWTVPLGGSVKPTNVSVSPSSGSGSSQTFSFLFTDSAGFADINLVQVHLQTQLVGQNACYLQFTRATNVIKLLADSGTNYVGSAPIGVAATLNNSQCTLDAGASSVTSSGTSVILNLALVFKPLFAGPKNVSMSAVNNANVFSGWQTMGAWTVTTQTGNQLPTNTSVTPRSGAGSGQLFSFVYSDAFGYADIDWVQIHFHTELVADHACYIQYTRATNSVRLLNDAGTDYVGAGGALGSAGTLSNSQCTLDAGLSSVSGLGNDLTVNLALTFPAGFIGAKTISMAASSNAGLFSGWQPKGTWNVTLAGNQLPTNVSVTPAAGAGSSQMFSFVYSDPYGYADIDWVQMHLQTQLLADHACYLQYTRATNSIQLLNDAGTGYVGAGGVLGSAGSLSNSQCTISLSGSSASATGNNLTVNVALAFTPLFTGTKTTSMIAINKAGTVSGWQGKGTWTVQ